MRDVVPIKMNIRYQLLLPALVLLSATFGCAKKTDHLDNIIRYQKNQIHEKGMTKIQYLSMVKPYSIWDSRPQHVPEIQWRGNSVQSRYVPDILWGYVGTTALNLPKEEIFPYPQKFVCDAHRQSFAYIMDANILLEEFQQLVSLVNQSTNNIYVRQDWLKTNAFTRINDVFCQDNTYWKYVIPEGSPYPMSPQVHKLKDFSFSLHDQSIFIACEKVGAYCVVKQEDCVIMMRGGMTGTSCGYIWAESEPTDTMLGHLFHLSRVKKINENLYYYVSD
ncbi:hypothetical protein ACFLS1_12750 [Verrucomicrobiota bacterium]